MDKIIMNGNLLECSSSNDGDLFAKFLICPLNQLNGNKVGLKQVDLSEEELLGINGKAVVTKVIKDANGEYDFSGHNVKRVTEIDKNGNVVQKIEFDTSPVGYHTEVSVEDVMYNDEVVPCIVATARIWSRYEKVMDVIERLGTNLKTSWEIAYEEAYFDNMGGKWIKGLTWLGNCLLGSNVRPAYKNAGLMEVAEEEQEMQLALAFTEDLVNETNSTNLENSNSNNKNLQGGMNMADNVKEISSLAVEDLRDKVRSAIYATEGNGRYYYGTLVYPYDFVAYAKLETRESTIEDYVKFAFTVNSDNTVSLSNQEDVKMVFMPKESYDTALAELNTKISEKDTEVSIKVEEIIKLGEVIQAKETEISEKDVVISELQPYKEKAEADAAAAKEAEIAEAKENLKKMVIASKYFTEEEIETSEELKTAIEQLDKKSINAMIGAKVVEKNTNVVLSTEEIGAVVSGAKIDTSSLVEHKYGKEENPILKFIKGQR